MSEGARTAVISTGGLLHGNLGIDADGVVAPFASRTIYPQFERNAPLTAGNIIPLKKGAGGQANVLKRSF